MWSAIIIYTRNEKEKKTTDIYLSLNEYFSSTNKGIHTHILNKLPIKRTKKCKNSRQYEISRKHQATNSIWNCVLILEYVLRTVSYAVDVLIIFIFFLRWFNGMFWFFNNGVTKLFKPEQCNDRMFIRDTKKKNCLNKVIGWRIELVIAYW